MIQTERGTGLVLAGGPLEGRRVVLFFRDFVQFFGGHLKVWHYFEHVRDSSRHMPVIAFSPRTRWDEGNPWSALRAQGAEVVRPARPDVLFVAGLDWLSLAPADRPRSAIPVINLLQHVRHGDPGDPRYEFLPHRAIRICVSEAVAAAVTTTGRVNGPVHVIPNGIDLADLPPAATWSERVWDVLIVALKAPELGATLLQRLAGEGRRVRVLDAWMPRQAFLRALSESRVTLLLPHAAEGFYLPAIEAMALGALVVCPDCVGNRSFCRPGGNCFQPAYTTQDLVEKTLEMLALPRGPREAMLAEARRTAEDHDLRAERSAFLDILEDAERVW